MEKGVGGFGKDGVAFRDKGAANFRGRGERAEAEERVQQLGRMVVRDQQITQPALHGGRGIADQDIVGRGNVQTLDLDLRPTRDFLLETDAAMPDQRNIERILLLHDGIAGKRVGLGQQKPASGAVVQGKVFLFLGVRRLRQSGKIRAGVVRSLCHTGCVAAVKPKNVGRDIPAEQPQRRAESKGADSRRLRPRG